MRKRLPLASLCLAALAASASAQETVKVGLIMTYSGQFTDPAAQMDNGIKLYMKQHGDTIGGKRIQIIRRDTAHEREIEMGVRIDAARHDVAAAGVDHFRSRRRVQLGADRDDGCTFNDDVGATRKIVVYDGAAADQDGHGDLRY